MNSFQTTLFSLVRGYTALEYTIRGELSQKADIYSFEVLVLEIISCRKKKTVLTLRLEMQYLPKYVCSNLSTTLGYYLESINAGHDMNTITWY